jgi:hypothetical protein
LLWLAALRRCGIHGKDNAACRDPIAYADLELLHDTGSARWHLHACLVRLKGDQRLLRGDLLPDGDQHLDDLHILEITNIRDLDLFDCHDHTSQGFGAATAKP